MKVGMPIVRSSVGVEQERARGAGGLESGYGGDEVGEEERTEGDEGD